MIEKLIGPPAACVERYDDGPGDPTSGLFPAEAALVARAVAKRRNEFATVRHCARQALAALGVAAAPILPGDRGAPQWPSGVVGSMTHCAGYRAAAVARADQLTGLGIDAEPDAPLPEGVGQLVVRTEEAAQLAELATVDRRVHWDRLLFSAKESVYKVWYPLTGRWLDFSEASITLGVDGTFQARLLVPGPLVAGVRVSQFDGRWAARDGLLTTAIALS